MYDFALVLNIIITVGNTCTVCEIFITLCTYAQQGYGIQSYAFGSIRMYNIYIYIYVCVYIVHVV